MRLRTWLLLTVCALLVVESPELRALAQPPNRPKTTSEKLASGSDAPADLEITLSEDAVTRIAAAAMPLTLQGTNTAKVEVPVIGFVEVKATWTAVVSNPKITITTDTVSFEADAAVSVAPLNYQDKVHGKVDVIYDKKKNQLVVKMKDVAMNVNLRHNGGGATVKVDITDQMPPLELPIGLPPPVLKVAKKTVRVELSPKIEYLEGKVRVSSPLKIVVPKSSLKQN